MFPANNVWNADISHLPLAANSAAMISSIGASVGLHPDFGVDLTTGIPYNVVGGSQSKVGVTFQYASESDPGPYPIPASPQIEGGSDAHMLIVDKDNCYLYELYSVSQSGGAWSAGSGAIWNLNSNALRPDGWTSADAAGLPILPGLARYDEYAAGVINHALRFTAQNTRNMHIYPARHDAGQANTAYPPMGLRVRLKASVNISGFSPQAQVVLAALKTYGMILADNGSNWYISGVSDPRWNDSDLHTLNQITGSSFEVVDTSSLVNGPDTATATPTVAGSTATSTPVPPTATPSQTPVPPTVTATRIPATNTATSTATGVPASSTATSVPATSTSTASQTPVPPTSTATPMSPTSTSTRVPPTASPTSTSTGGGTVVLTPAADAFVRDGTYSNTNYGAATTLDVKRASTGNNRYSYLRFDLQGVTGTITGATLRLYGRNTGTGSYSRTEAVYPVASTTWIETGLGGITWNTKPALGASALATTVISTTSQFYAWNVGPYVVQQQGAKAVSLVLVMPVKPSNNSLDRFNSREASSNQPQLVVTTQ
jgi:hypothetical protein